MSEAVFVLHRGSAPLLVSLPHDGTALPDAIGVRMTPRARQVPDTDWHVSRLYDFARELGASILVPGYSRYVIDLNRGEDDTSLYPGQNTTGLVPLVRFTGAAIPALYTPAILTAGALWLLAFLLYVIALWPVFWGPRQPRKPAGRAPA